MVLLEQYSRTTGPAVPAKVSSCPGLGSLVRERVISAGKEVENGTSGVSAMHVAGSKNRQERQQRGRGTAGGIMP